jgi:hypothetical protein
MVRLAALLVAAELGGKRRVDANASDLAGTAASIH